MTLLAKAYIAFLPLPALTWIEASTRAIPPDVFYSIWTAYSGLFAILVVVGSYKEHRHHGPFVALLLMVFSLSIITPASVPANVLDDNPSTTWTVQLASNLVSFGGLRAINVPAQYLSYPLSIIQLAIGEIITGSSSVWVPKLFAVLLSLFPAIISYSCLRNRRVALLVATVVGLSPWIIEYASHYTPEAEGGVMLVMAISILFAGLSSENNRLFLPLPIIIISLLMTDVFYGFVWVLMLLILFVCSNLLGIRRLKGPPFTTLVLLSVCGWGSWYVLGSGAALVLGSFSSMAHQIFAGFAATMTYVAPSGTRSLWLVVPEYATFLSLGICSLSAVFFYRKRIPANSAFALSTAAVAASTFLPWLAGFSLGTDLASRSIFVFQVGSAFPIGYLLTEAMKSKPAYTRLIVFFVIALVSLNALLYGVTPYRYNATTPLNVEDTRFNLESWNYFGDTICNYSGTNHVWGVRLGVTFVACEAYTQLSPSVTSTAGVSAVGLLDLQSSLGHNKLVVLRNSLGDVNEWPQPLPATTNAIMSKYDVVFTTGDPVLIYTK